MFSKIDFNLVLLVTTALLFVSFVVVATVLSPDHVALIAEHCIGDTKWFKVEGMLNTIQCK